MLLQTCLVLEGHCCWHLAVLHSVWFGCKLWHHTLEVHFLQQLWCLLSNLHSIPVHVFMFGNLTAIILHLHLASSLINRTSYKLDKIVMHYLLNKLLWSTFGIWGLLWVPHLKTCKVQNGMMARQHSCNGAVSVSIIKVVISSSKLCSMIFNFVPPVNSRYLLIMV